MLNGDDIHVVYLYYLTCLLTGNHVTVTSIKQYIMLLAFSVCCSNHFVFLMARFYAVSYTHLTLPTNREV